MFFKIVSCIQFILALIHEAETRFGPGAGVEKKADVMKATAKELRRQGLHGPENDAQQGNVLARSGEIVDGLVKIFNVTNTFKHERSSSTDTPAAPEPDPQPAIPPAATEPDPQPAAAEPEPPPEDKPKDELELESAAAAAEPDPLPEDKT